MSSADPLSAIFDNSLSIEEAKAAFKESFSNVGRTIGIDRWIITAFDGNCRNVNPLVWYDVDAVEPMIPVWSEQDPAIAGRVRRWFARSKEGEIQRWHLPADLRDTKREMVEVFRKAGIKSGISIPLSSKEPFAATFSAFTTHAYRCWPDDLIPIFRFFGDSLMVMLGSKCLAEMIGNGTRAERIASKGDWIPERGFTDSAHGGDALPHIIGGSKVLQTILTKVRQVAPTRATVLILGETGVGKGVFAHAIHAASVRRDRPFVQVNCAALSPHLSESELFGHEKGAFTTAVAGRLGRFEVADGGTLFLDEIGELPLGLQSKLLRVLDDGEFERVGASRTIRADVRVVAATNRDLAKDVEAGRFRRDLWYRLNVFPISIPPLRERRDDIGPLITHLIQGHEQRLGRAFDPIPPHVMTTLSGYPWPGNIRELENVIQRAVITAVDRRLSIDVPGSSPVQPSLLNRRLEDVEREHMLAVLQSVNWRIQGLGGAAQRLGLKPSTLRSRMKNLCICRPGPFDEAWSSRKPGLPGVEPSRV